MTSSAWFRVAAIGMFHYLALSATAEAASPENEWPQFRGPGALGVADGANLPDRWSATDNVLWKQAIAGRGWSSPIVWGDKIFVTTVINTGESEKPTKGLYFGGNRPKPPETPHQWKVLCLNLNSGSIVWEKTVHEGVPAQSLHLKNSYASETPVTDGERVYAYFGNLGVWCFDFAGREVWSKPFEPHATRFGWGTAASPVLHAGRLYIVDDNDEKSFLVAFDAKTGDEIWRVARDEKSNWATPYIWQNDLRTEIVTPGTGKVRSYDLDGQLLWEFSGMSSITIPTPFSKFGLLYVTSGYVMDKLRPLYAIKPGASGDISLQEDETTSEFIAWTQKQAGPYNTSPVLYGETIYVLLDRGFFAAYDAKTGAEVYKQERIPEGRAFTASPWAADGKIFCLNEDGVTFVIKAGPTFEILHTNSLGDDVMCMATPAVAGDKLLIRTDTQLYCLQQGAKLAAE
ncbi:MAG: PQQ-binding-like beta-propeller repeat protein [Planctomycetaceae bacterium]|nr:PQQ-binding-like beta-propeller repeat protein [Planctomycetaceae bacterium]